MIVAEDGRVYFTYFLGAAYKFLPRFSSAFEYKILDCEYENGKEYYRIESAGNVLPTRFSLARLEFVFRQTEFEQTEEGEPVELPLLAEEVKAFYAAKAKEMRRLNVAENAKLNGTAWNSNLKVISNLTERLRYCENAGEDELARELRANLTKIKEEQAKLLAEKAVDERLLRKLPDCVNCNDTGFAGGEICECAQVQADRIKAFAAAERLARK